MSRDTERARLFTRRAVLIGAAQAGLFSLILGRLYYLQVLQKAKFSTLAEDNRINLRLIPPQRGQIFDRTGQILAVNQQNYRLVLLPEQVKSLTETLDKVAPFVGLTEADRKRIDRDFKNLGGLNAVMVRDNLTWEQVSAISLNLPNLTGTDIEVGEVRTYPYTGMTAHVVGYVGAVSQSDKDSGRSSLNMPGFRIGKSAIERHYDLVLRGEPGNVQLEMNARGRVVRELARNEPVPGKDLVLTIDMGLQQIVQKRLEQEESAAVVVLDIYTGAVYSLVSYPGFDPNLFTYGISQQDWDALNNDEHVPLLNKALDGVYAPGSVFKIVTALAGLDSGILNPKEPVYCSGHVDLGKHRFHCWKKGGHGPVNFVQAMAGSCDSYFYEMGKRIGIDRLHAMAKRLGLGQKTLIDFPHERPGLIPSRAWKVATRGDNWQQGETLITAIGQGYVLTSPMQLAIMAARIANGGLAITPHIVRGQGEQLISRPPPVPLGLDPKHLSIVMDALSAVVNQPIGTAHSARIMDETMAMAGKTGTAQVRRISTAERADGVISNEALPWKERDHALFVAYAPTSNPRYAVSVVVEHGGSGAHVAAPIARDILLACQQINPAGV
ncbi:MAG TPA: penicillin-binding protein 2 [Rhodospirillaceae bacterium]|nr:penicillin-binding protein 2 [Rhodospirillaceae bacterium]